MELKLEIEKFAFCNMPFWQQVLHLQGLPASDGELLDTKTISHYGDAIKKANSQGRCTVLLTQANQRPKMEFVRRVSQQLQEGDALVE